jgi:hypothetical protein
MGNWNLKINPLQALVVGVFLVPGITIIWVTLGFLPALGVFLVSIAASIRVEV